MLPEVALMSESPGATVRNWDGGGACKLTELGLELVQLVEALFVISWVDPSLKMPMAWNWIEQPVGTSMIAVATGHGVNSGVGVGLSVIVVTTGVSAGGPLQTLIFSSDGPIAVGTPQGPSGIPPVPVIHGALEPPPQLHPAAPATNIIAAPIRIQRAREIIRAPAWTVRARRVKNAGRTRANFGRQKFHLARSGPSSKFRATSHPVNR
jgi:hypothetical protein